MRIKRVKKLTETKLNSPAHVLPSGAMAVPGGHEQFPNLLHFSMQAMSLGKHFIFSSVDRCMTTMNDLIGRNLFPFNIAFLAT